MSKRSAVGVVQEYGRQAIRSEFAILLILIAMCGVMSFLSPDFLTVSNLINVLQRSATTGIVALGMTFVILTGGIDLSVGGQVVLISVIGAMLMVGGVAVPLAVLAMIALGALLGSLNGIAVTILGLPPFIATLAMMNITRGMSLFINQGKTVFGLPESYEFFGLSWRLGLPMPIWIFGLLFGLAFFVLQYTTYGRNVYAVGSGPKAAWLAGIKVRAVYFSVYVISGILSAIGAIVLTSRLLSAPGTMGLGLELDAIAAVVIGGTSTFGGEGNIAGTVVGTLIIEVIGNAMNLLAVSPFLQEVVKGLIILLALVLDMWRKGYIFKRSYAD
jgi:ribose/xylose/arabinose/galactoside ABC-type transport system permease subunit